MTRHARLAALLVLLLARPCAAQLPNGYDVQVRMRDSGYVLGDLIEQTVELHAPASAQLEAESVPVQGRINNWMELREQRIRRTADGYEIALTYQVFGAVENALRLAIPGFRLRLHEGDKPVLAEIAPQPFYLSPVLPSVLADTDRQPRASLAPDPFPERPPLLAAGLGLLLAAAFAFFLAWADDRLPFLPRSPGPLTRLFRKLRRLRTGDLHGPAYVALLQDVQSAFNRSANQTLYADNLALLFERTPSLTPLRERIESLFQHTRDVLYGARQQAPSWPAAEVIELCREARDCERGLS
ncbi:MAG: hypothetical protein ACT4QA_09115 [Panacagrimonas sp.]